VLGLSDPPVLRFTRYDSRFTMRAVASHETMSIRSKEMLSRTDD
jgi:hypothetical protein